MTSENMRQAPTTADLAWDRYLRSLEQMRDAQAELERLGEIPEKSLLPVRIPGARRYRISKADTDGMNTRIF